MELERLIQQLRAPSAYPYRVEQVEARQTHISVVFLAGPFAYKIKKPVHTGFADFSTLQKRLHFCEEEVRLNRRLAPEVYLGVVPIQASGSGLQIEGSGEPLEWAVKMQRLPVGYSFEDRLARNELPVPLVDLLAQRLAAFHSQAYRDERMASLGSSRAVSRLIEDVLAGSLAQVGSTVSQEVYHRLQERIRQSLGSLQQLMEARAAGGMIRECHGDLHLDHVYYFPDRPSPADLVIIDCIDFNERFRCIDPVADMAFAFMDFTFHGRRDLARTFADAYFRRSGDSEGAALLPLYSSYRAAVRGAVEGLLLSQTEVPSDERSAILPRARAHWLLALAELEPASQKPCLLLVAGLPGAGKSSLARALAERGGFTLLRSDVIRKELAGLALGLQTGTTLPGDHYSPDWTRRTYAECLRRAEELLFEGRRVIVDATFRDEHQRQTFLQAALRWAVPPCMLLCQASPETIRDRLQHRKNDASDATWATHVEMAASWDSIDPATGAFVHLISTEGSLEHALEQALPLLAEVGVLA